MKGIHRVVLSLLALVLFPMGLLAQAYGTGSQITVIPAAAFRGETSADQYTSNQGVGLAPTTDTTTTFVAPVQIPSGAVIQKIEILVTDLDPNSDITASLADFAQGVATATSCGPAVFIGWSGSSSGLAGTGLLTLAGQLFSLRYRNGCNFNDSYFQYYLRVQLQSTSQSLSGAVVTWFRGVSPAPATATFDDVPTSDPFFRAIEALAASGITSGCGNNNFCPNQVVTRNQLAKFLANALGLHFPQ